MFFPMSCMSPKTVAMTIEPLFSCLTPVAARCCLMTLNALPTVSALSKSCGRNFFPVSKSFPTLSSAGTMQLFIIDTGSSCARSVCTAPTAWSLNPFIIIEMNASSSGVAAIAGDEVPAADEVPDAAEVPDEVEAPAAGEIPDEAELPAADEVPDEAEPPAADEVPAEDDAATVGSTVPVYFSMKSRQFVS